MTDYLILGLKAAAIGQLALALLNLSLPQLLDWKDELAKLSALPREVFHVHAWFISITVALFGILSWRFAADFATGANPLARWLSTGIGIFWGIRLVLQWTYYSWDHWRNKLPETAAHVILTIVYGAWAAIYLLGGRMG